MKIFTFIERQNASLNGCVVFWSSFNYLFVMPTSSLFFVTKFTMISKLFWNKNAGHRRRLKKQLLLFHKCTIYYIVIQSRRQMHIQMFINIFLRKSLHYYALLLWKRIEMYCLDSYFTLTFLRNIAKITFKWKFTNYWRDAFDI